MVKNRQVLFNTSDKLIEDAQRISGLNITATIERALNEFIRNNQTPLDRARADYLASLDNTVQLELTVAELEAASIKIHKADIMEKEKTITEIIQSKEEVIIDHIRRCTECNPPEKLINSRYPDAYAKYLGITKEQALAMIDKYKVEK